MATKKLSPVPVVGQDIYVPTELYISHGKDDIQGGLAEISSVVSEMHGDRKVHKIKVKELPHKSYVWENHLAENQENLAKRFGEQRAKPDPDERPEFNSGARITKSDLRRWLQEGKEMGATHVIVMSDTYDYVYYPVYVMPGDNPRKVGEKESGTDTSVKEVYSLSLDIELQLAEDISRHYD